MSTEYWTLDTVEASRIKHGHSYTLTLRHTTATGTYTAHLSRRVLDSETHVSVHKLRTSRPPLAVWPEDGTRRPLTRRSALYEPLQQLHTHWSGTVCSLAVHAYLDTHSPYCLPACPVPVHRDVQAQSTTHSTQQAAQP